MSKPNEAATAGATLAHMEARELAHRLIADGVDWRAVLAGMGAAAAEMLAERAGSTAIAGWHDTQARLARSTFGG